MGNWLSCLSGNESKYGINSTNSHDENEASKNTMPTDYTDKCHRKNKQDMDENRAITGTSSEIKIPEYTIATINTNLGEKNLHKNETISSTSTKENQIQLSDNTLNALFEKYKDENEDAILSEGIECLCNDLGYKPDDFAILVLAWRLDASEMCRFTKSEFIHGLQTLNADTTESIRNRLEQIIEMLKVNSEMFKQLYRFTFRFGLEPTNRIVLIEMALILWRLVFTVHKPDILERWLDFLEQQTNIRGIPKDTWNMFLNFAETCDINAYDDAEAWPSLFDDFVEYERERLKQISATDKNDNNNE